MLKGDGRLELEQPFGQIGRCQANCSPCAGTWPGAWGHCSSPLRKPGHADTFSSLVGIQPLSKPGHADTCWSPVGARHAASFLFHIV